MVYEPGVKMTTVREKISPSIKCKHPNSFRINFHKIKVRKLSATQVVHPSIIQTVMMNVLMDWW